MLNCVLPSARLRSQAKSWAASFGEDAKAAMVTFQRQSTRLALHRQRVRRHRSPDPAGESALLGQIQVQRYSFGHAVARRR